MQNLLVIESNLIQAYCLINSICKKISNIRLYNIVSTGMEAMDIIKDENVDIIILDLELSDMNGIDIINFISRNNMSRYNSSIMVFTNEIDLVNEKSKNQYVFGYYSKITDIDFIIKRINDLIDKKIENSNIQDIKKRIDNELEKLTFDLSFIGYIYLYECIYECYCRKDVYNVNFNKDIYPIISKKYCKTVNSIKTSIFYSISNMYYRINEVILSEYFGYKIINRPKTKEIITTILKKL